MPFGDNYEEVDSETIFRMFFNLLLWLKYYPRQNKKARTLPCPGFYQLKLIFLQVFLYISAPCFPRRSCFHRCAIPLRSKARGTPSMACPLAGAHGPPALGCFPA